MERFKKTPIRKMECTLCGKFVSTKIHILQQHIDRFCIISNPDLSNYMECDLCGKRLKSKATLNSHRKYFCSTIEKKYVQCCKCLSILNIGCKRTHNHHCKYKKEPPKYITYIHEPYPYTCL